MITDVIFDTRPRIRLMLALTGDLRIEHFQTHMQGMSAEIVLAEKPGDIADAAIDGGMIDALMLDSTFCGREAVWLCAHVAKHTSAAVIYVSDSESDRLNALSQGADDCVASTCSAAEVLARILAIRRRLANASVRQTKVDPMGFAFEGYEYSHALRRLIRPDGEVVHLTSAIASTLMAFLSNPGRSLSRDQLRTALGKHGEISEVDLNVNIHRLRKVLGEPPGSPSLIGTLRARGYRFDGRVRSVSHRRLPFELAAPNPSNLLERSSRERAA